MYRIRGWYNQNRKIIWVVILTIVAVITLIQNLNNYYEKRAKDESSSTSNSTTTYNADNYSIVTNKKIDENTAKKSSNIIEEFFEYCNSQKIEEAYNMLSTDCKQELYPTVEDFKSNYYDRMFTEKKTCKQKLWITASNKNTYRVQIMADLLSTGEAEYMPIEDYYTMINEDGNYKLNICKYIGKEDINSSKKQNDITVNIVSKRIYMDYEIYEIEVKNNTESKIIFNTKENTDSMYLQDENKVKYIAFLNEIPNNQFEISSGFTKKLTIKFNRGYKPDIKIKKVIFGDISTNYNTKLEKIEVEI